MSSTKSSQKNRKQQIMVPIHIKITEEMHELLTKVAHKHGFPRIQGLIRLYIRQGLDAEDVDYSLADDERFLQKLRRQGVSEEVLNAALQDDHVDTVQHAIEDDSDIDNEHDFNHRQV